MSLPSGLAELQAWMQQSLIYQGQPPANLANIINDSNQLDAAQHLHIYQRSYYLRLISCMREQFPALCYALGEPLFNDFAREYLIHYPSNSYTLYELGRRFARYLEESNPDAEKPVAQQETWINFMIDMAQFERRVFTLFDQVEEPHKTFASEQTNDEHLALQDCINLSHYRFDVSQYYHAVRKQLMPKLPPLQTSYIALVRRNYLTHIVPLSFAQYTFLTAMKTGLSVHKALIYTAEVSNIPLTQVKDSWTNLNGIRQRWIKYGLFINSNDISN